MKELSSFCKYVTYGCFSVFGINVLFMHSMLQLLTFISFSLSLYIVQYKYHWVFSLFGDYQKACCFSLTPHIV